MRSLSFIIIIFTAFNLFAQKSPHGKNLTADCSSCHQPTTWKVDISRISFDHDTTGFKLTGQHKSVNCRQCHQSLTFTGTKADCFSCHTDVHRNTVGLECSNCHTPDTWIVKDIIQIHKMSRFPLVGRHAVADCIQCHKSYNNLLFEPLEISCYSCHVQDYLNTTSPNHTRAGFSTDCQECHSISSPIWKGSVTNINHSFFPLIGGHNIANCFSCHKRDTFAGLSPECYSCHKQDYEGVQDPNHVTGQFPHDCTQCHTIQGFKPASFDHNNTAFPLTGAHINTACSSCHSQGFSGTSTECAACHTTDYNNAQNPNHRAAGISTECRSCHTTTAFIPSTFNHTATGFQLTGTHAEIACSSCHAGTTSGASPECYGCHQQNYNTAPNHVSQQYPKDCTLCHNTISWGDANFSHQNTAFPLTGAHTSVECSSCHQSGFAGTPITCVSCHQQNYNQAANPSHISLQLSTDCQTCHTTNSGWKPATFPVHNNYYQLLGAHAAIQNDCATCHNGNYNNTPNTCYGCHQQDYNNTTNPDHQAAGFSTDCATCHSQNAWKPSTFNHDGQYFPIYSGKHKDKWNTCADCHTNQSNFGVFSCITCHEHNKTDMDEEHQGISGYTYESNACYSCHPTGQKEGAFNHTQTGFPLTGQHTNLSCLECHQGGFNNASPECISCHQAKYNNAVNPNHVAAGIPVTCQDCHTTSGWTPSTFNHSNTGFPLLGQHQAIACSSCHNGTVAGAPTLCLGCHQQNYNTAPNHVSQGYPTTCETCHNTVAWSQTTFNHNNTQFPLTGAHTQVSCSNCHSGGFAGTPTTCISCHQQNYNTAPNHVSQGYPTTCETCHNTVAWNQTTFNHNNTQFPLTGAHTQVSCSNCHSGGFAGTPTACVNCHQQNYNQTTNPSHASLQLSTDCQTCHTTNPGWKPATFPAHNNYYQLLGAHAAIQNDCVTCHNGNYNNTPNTCYGCHQQDYNNTTNPNHAAAQFPHECESCHSQTAWVPSTFNHDGQYFPIYSGRHNNEWNTCADCHTDPSNFAVFSCITCHAHRQSEMDNEHQGVSGYVYNSQACYNCHPTGQGDKAIKRMNNLQ